LFATRSAACAQKLAAAAEKMMRKTFNTSQTMSQI
jgi:hypothetical protein